MKTVKEYFDEVDAERLVDNYTFRYQADLIELLECKEMAIDSFLEMRKNAFRAFINRLREMEPAAPADDECHIFFAYRSIGDGDEGLGFGMVTKEELMEKGDEAPVYSVMLVKQAEILGYYVADNDLTQHNIYDLLAYIMRESSYFGFKQERLEETIQSLEESEKELKENPGSGRDAREVFRELREKLGIEDDDDDEESEDEKELYRKIIEAQYNYRKHSMKKELNILLKELQ